MFYAVWLEEMAVQMQQRFSFVRCRKQNELVAKHLWPLTFIFPRNSCLMEEVSKYVHRQLKANVESHFSQLERLCAKCSPRYAPKSLKY